MLTMDSSYVSRFVSRNAQTAVDNLNDVPNEMKRCLNELDHKISKLVITEIVVRSSLNSKGEAETKTVRKYHVCDLSKGDLAVESLKKDLRIDDIIGFVKPSTFFGVQVKGVGFSDKGAQSDVFLSDTISLGSLDQIDTIDAIDTQFTKAQYPDLKKILDAWQERE